MAALTLIVLEWSPASEEYRAAAETRLNLKIGGEQRKDETCRDV